MSDDSEIEREAKRPGYGWLSITVAAILGLFYAYDLWEAVSNLVQLPGVYDLLGIGSAKVPWWLLIIGLAIPPVIFGLALLIGRRRNVFGKALIFVMGLTVVAGLSLGVIALEAVLRPVVVTVTG